MLCNQFYQYLACLRSSYVFLQPFIFTDELQKLSTYITSESQSPRVDVENVTAKSISPETQKTCDTEKKYSTMQETVNYYFIYNYLLFVLCTVMS